MCITLKQKYIQVGKGKRTLPKVKSDVHLMPDRIWDLIYEMFRLRPIDLFDPCPADTPHKAPCFFNGLYIDWGAVNVVNPPYGDSKKGGTLLSKFVQKAYHEHTKGKFSIMLLPAKTDQPWFHDIVIRYEFKVVFLQGRLKFKNDKDYSTQAHMLVIIGKP